MGWPLHTSRAPSRRHVSASVFTFIHRIWSTVVSFPANKPEKSVSVPNAMPFSWLIAMNEAAKTISNANGNLFRSYMVFQATSDNQTGAGLCHRNGLRTHTHVEFFRERPECHV